MYFHYFCKTTQDSLIILMSLYISVGCTTICNMVPVRSVNCDVCHIGHFSKILPTLYLVSRIQNRFKSQQRSKFDF